MQGADKEAQVQNAAAKLSDLLDRRRDQYAQADIKISLQGRDSNGASLPEVASRYALIPHTRSLSTF